MKFFAIVKTFDKKQWMRFVTYVQLYHNPDSVAVKLTEWFSAKNIWKGWDEKYQETEFLLSALPFKLNRQTLSNNITILGNIAEEYLGWVVWKDSPKLKRSSQLLGLARKSLTTQYIKSQSELKNEKSDRYISIWDDFYEMQSLFFNYYFGMGVSANNFLFEFESLVEKFRKSVSSIAQILFVEMRNREVLLSESWPLPEFFFKKMVKEKSELFKLTEHLTKMIKYSNQQSYNHLIKALKFDVNKSLSHHIKYTIASYCIIFLTGEIKKGHVNRGMEILDLYEYCLENKILTLSEKMNMTKFLSIVGIASKLNKHERARKIVDKWAIKVDEVEHKSISKLGYATIDFHQEKYASVISTLSQIKSTNYLHRLRSRWLLIQAQFMLNRDYVEALKVQIDNFRRFLNANQSKNTRTTNEGYKSTIKILNMILDRKPKDDIFEYYQSREYVFDRKWTYSQIKNPVS